MGGYGERTPVNIITGFLGSGKTTLLQRLLESPQAANAAVIINEFGDVSLDHLLLETVDGEISVLKGGCVCCTVRTDLSAAILSLYDKRQSGEIPFFDRVVIETTGLADPAPIVATLMLENIIKHHFRLGNIIATFDALNAKTHLQDNEETLKQLAVADQILITKTDIASPGIFSSLRAELQNLNPAAQIHNAAESPGAHTLLVSDVYDQNTRLGAVENWQSPPAHAHQNGGHTSSINSLSIEIEQPLDWNAFGLWLGFLLHAHGDRLLRLKGILHLKGEDLPIAIHGVQHTIHPPQHLPGWPDANRTSSLVLIYRDLDPGLIKKSLETFLTLGETM